MSGAVTFSITIPTVGRPALRQLLIDILEQLGPSDEILVIGDGPQPAAAEMCNGLDQRVRYLEHGPDHAWGHPQRNWAMKQARGTHLLSYDDDDVLLEDAIQIIHNAVACFPDRPHIFRMKHLEQTIWTDSRIRVDNISTQMIVVPNRPGRVGLYGRVYSGDFEFLKSTVALYPEKESCVVWHPDLIVLHGVQGATPARPPRSSPTGVVQAVNLPEGRSMNPLLTTMFRGMAGDAKEYGSNMATHMPVLHVLAKNWSFGHLVELGVGRGWSTLALLSGSIEGDRDLISYDIEPKAFDRAIAALGVKKNHPVLKSWIFRVNTSIKAAADFQDRSISLLFLDTTHTYADTQHELQTWLPKMHPNSVMCGHDYLLHEHPDWAKASGVKKAVDEFAGRYANRFRLQIFPHDFGLWVLWPRSTEG